MAEITFTKSHYEEYVPKLQDYIESEFDMSLGNMDAQFFLDYIAQTLGPHFYNQGIKDATTKLHQMTDIIEGELDTLIKI